MLSSTRSVEGSIPPAHELARRRVERDLPRTRTGTLPRRRPANTGRSPSAPRRCEKASFRVLDCRHADCLDCQTHFSPSGSEDPDEGQIPVGLGVVEAVADDEMVVDGEAEVVHRDALVAGDPLLSRAQILTDFGCRVPRISTILWRVRPVSTMSSTMMTSRPATSVEKVPNEADIARGLRSRTRRRDLEEVERDGCLQPLGQIAEKKTESLEDPDEEHGAPVLVAVDLGTRSGRCPPPGSRRRSACGRASWSVAGPVRKRPRPAIQWQVAVGHDSMSANPSQAFRARLYPPHGEVQGALDVRASSSREFTARSFRGPHEPRAGSRPALRGGQGAAGSDPRRPAGPRPGSDPRDRGGAGKLRRPIAGLRRGFVSFADAPVLRESPARRRPDSAFYLLLFYLTRTDADEDLLDKVGLPRDSGGFGERRPGYVGGAVRDDIRALFDRLLDGTEAAPIDAEVAAQVAGAFDELASQIAATTDFAGLAAEGRDRALRTLKRQLARGRVQPEILTAVASCNLTARAVFQRLYEKSEARCAASERIDELERRAESWTWIRRGGAPFSRFRKDGGRPGGRGLLAVAPAPGASRGRGGGVECSRRLDSDSRAIVEEGSPEAGRPFGKKTRSSGNPASVASGRPWIPRGAGRSRASDCHLERWEADAAVRSTSSSLLSKAESVVPVRRGLARQGGKRDGGGAEPKGGRRSRQTSSSKRGRLSRMSPSSITCSPRLVGAQVFSGAKDEDEDVRQWMRTRLRLIQAAAALWIESSTSPSFVIRTKAGPAPFPVSAFSGLTRALPWPHILPIQ